MKNTKQLMDLIDLLLTFFFIVLNAEIFIFNFNLMWQRFNGQTANRPAIN